MTMGAPALTPGEPAGIGPDIALAAAASGSVPFVAFADPDVLRDRASRLGIEIGIRTVAAGVPDARTLPRGELPVVPIAAPNGVVPGRLDPGNSRYVLECIRRAVAACRDGAVSGLVTGPVHKGIVNDAGIAFTGHTELLAELDGGTRPVMMLCTPGLRVALATTHLPLRQVPDAIDSGMLIDTIRIVDRDLRARFAIAQPRIVVCGLNPHAGEGGHLGHEDGESIVPAVDALRAAGVDVRGPVPADTAFTPGATRRHRRRRCDVSRPGPAGAQARRLRRSDQRHSRAELPADIGRSRDRARPRGYGNGRAFEPRRRSDPDSGACAVTRRQPGGAQRDSMSHSAASRKRPPPRGAKARKRFGQHFLRDPSVVRSIVDAIAPQPGELIVEIGPGRGALTFPLLNRGCDLHAIEIDRDLAAALRSRARHLPNLFIHEADALRVDPRPTSLRRRAGCAWRETFPTTSRRPFCSDSSRHCRAFPTCT